MFVTISSILVVGDVASKHQVHSELVDVHTLLFSGEHPTESCSEVPGTARD